jgi:hypothetical protein
MTEGRSDSPSDAQNGGSGSDNSGIPKEFRTLLTGFRNLSAWAVGAGMPFAAGLVTLSPPWPPGIVAATAVVELVVLVLVFQSIRHAPRKVVNRVLWIGAIVFGALCLVYLAGLSRYTFATRTTHERFVKGLECTQDALKVYGPKCPDLDGDDLAAATYEADRLWTNASIAIVRVGLVAVWSSAFVALATVLGSFLVFQAHSVPKNSANFD